MGLIEVIVIAFSVVFVASVFGMRIYKRIKRMPSSECSGCHGLSGKKLVEEYRKTYCVEQNKRKKKH